MADIEGKLISIRNSKEYQEDLSMEISKHKSAVMMDVNFNITMLDYASRFPWGVAKRFKRYRAIFKKELGIEDEA